MPGCVVDDEDENQESKSKEIKMTDQEWPKLDPITGRMICRSCWNLIHHRKTQQGQLVHACDGECDCVHRSEQAYAAIEQGKARENRRELRKRLKEQLEAPNNPLLAVNDSFNPKKNGKAHA